MQQYLPFLTSCSSLPHSLLHNLHSSLITPVLPSSSRPLHSLPSFRLPTSQFRHCLLHTPHNYSLLYTPNSPLLHFYPLLIPYSLLHTPNLISLLPPLPYSIHLTLQAYDCQLPFSSFLIPTFCFQLPVPYYSLPSPYSLIHTLLSTLTTTHAISSTSYTLASSLTTSYTVISTPYSLLTTPFHTLLPPYSMPSTLATCSSLRL